MIDDIKRKHLRWVYKQDHNRLTLAEFVSLRRRVSSGWVIKDVEPVFAEVSFKTVLLQAKKLAGIIKEPNELLGLTA